MLITLSGFMGSGKTTVGQVLAGMLGCPFMDLDDIVVKKAGKSIPEIFSDSGEEGFRAIEKDCLKSTVAAYCNATAVLSLGGGTLMDPASAKLVSGKSVCIYLRASEATLASRLEGETEARPLARGSWRELFEKRLPIYQKTAAVIIDTDGLSPEDIAGEIIIDCL